MSRTFIPTTDLRIMMNQVNDQRNRPTCVAFAVTAAHEFFRKYDTKLSEEFLYRLCKIRDGNNNDGTSVQVALKNLESIGQVDSLNMPYDPNVFDTSSRLTLNYFRDARSKRIPSWQQNIPLINQIERTIDSEKSIVCVIEVQKPFFYANKTENFIDLPQQEFYKDQYHAILLVGYGFDSLGQKYFVIRNSWGIGWGEVGYAYLSYEYFKKYQKGIWIIA